MSLNIDYAFLTRMNDVAKPRVFPSLLALAQHIERRRLGQMIQLEEIEDLHARRRMATGATDTAPGRGLRDRGVQVWALCLDGSRDRSLGFAWLKGGGAEELQRKLEQVALSNGVDPRRAVAA